MYLWEGLIELLPLPVPEKSVPRRFVLGSDRRLILLLLLHQRLQQRLMDAFWDGLALDRRARHRLVDLDLHLGYYVAHNCHSDITYDGGGSIDKLGVFDVLWVRGVVRLHVAFALDVNACPTGGHAHAQGDVELVCNDRTA